MGIIIVALLGVQILFFIGITYVLIYLYNKYISTITYLIKKYNLSYYIYVLILIPIIIPVIYIYSIFNYNNKLLHGNINVDKFSIKSFDISYNQGQFINIIGAKENEIIGSNGNDIMRYDIASGNIINTCTGINIDTGNIGDSLNNLFFLEGFSGSYLVSIIPKDVNNNDASPYEFQILNINTCERHSSFFLTLSSNDELKNGKFLHIQAQQDQDLIIILLNQKIYSFNLREKRLIEIKENALFDLTVNGESDVNGDGVNELIIGKNSKTYDSSGPSFFRNEDQKFAFTSLNYELKNEIPLFNFDLFTWQQDINCGGNIHYQEIEKNRILICEGYTGVHFINENGQIIKTIPYDFNKTKEGSIIPLFPTILLQKGSFNILNTNSGKKNLINRTIFDGLGNEIITLPSPVNLGKTYIKKTYSSDIDRDGNNEIILIDEEQSFFPIGLDTDKFYQYLTESYMRIYSYEGKLLFVTKLPDLGPSKNKNLNIKKISHGLVIGDFQGLNKVLILHKNY